jgi:hypothetical protein
VDVEGSEYQDEVEIDDLDIHHDNSYPIEVAPTQATQAPEMTAPVAPPTQTPELCRSTRVRSQANQGYTLSMTGSKYSYAVTHMESQIVLNPDVHTFVQEDFHQAKPTLWQPL